MSEIYRNSTQNVYLDMYGDGVDAAPSAEIFHSGSSIRTVTATAGTAPDGAEERWVVPIGLGETSFPGEVRVRWTFTLDGAPAVKDDYLDVVVPLVDTQTAREELTIPADITDDQIVRAERRARVQIENGTGQKFSAEVATLTGTIKEGAIRLPRRLLSVDTVGGYFGNMSLAQNYYAIEDDGWTLRYPYNYTVGQTIRSEGVIADPYTTGYYGMYPNGLTALSVTGTWGWERVPTDITEAALILIEANLCPDSVYRERYLVSMTAADWRIQFDKAAYAGTGNVIADQILAKYQTTRVAVI